MPDADLYLDRIELERYLGAEKCQRCGAHSCKELVAKLRKRECDPEHLEISERRRRALATALGIDGVLPSVPSMQFPRPVDPDLVALEGAGPGDPLLVTGNSEFTQEVVLAVISSATTPLRVLFSDTRGDTLDMALILGSFTPERVARSMERSGLGEPSDGDRIVLPGLASGIADDVAEATGWRVEVGPVCIAELPLWFGDDWKTSGRCHRPER